MTRTTQHVQFDFSFADLAASEFDGWQSLYETPVVDFESFSGPVGNLTPEDMVLSQSL